MSASIVTLKDGQTENIQYPKTVKSALMKDDGTPLNPIEPSQIINDITTGGVAVPLSAQQGVVLDEKISTTDSKIGILSELETVDKTNVVGAINENTSAIGQLQTDISNIDVSWNAITGKPTTFTPATHVHTKADVGLGSVLNYDIATQAEVDAATSNVKYVTPLGLAGLKSSVVNGKQEVVNAINDSLGYASGLTTSHTHGDYAWWIQNKVNTEVRPSGIERLMKYISVGMSSGGSRFSDNPHLKILPQTYYNDKAYSVTLGAVGTYYLVDNYGSIEASYYGYVYPGKLTAVSNVQYSSMSGRDYYGSVVKVASSGLCYIENDNYNHSVIYELTPDAMKWFLGLI